MSITTDVARLTAMLWTPEEKVGRSGLTLAAVVRAAVELADADGLEKCSMRRLAEHVGVGTMTLYQYVPGREQLITLMLDHLASELYADRGLPADRPSWQEAMRHVAACRWQHLMAHPWLCEVPPARDAVGPGGVATFEAELTPLDGIGLDDLEMDSLLASVVHLAHATARWQIGVEASRADSHLTDQQWWDATWPVLALHFDDTDYPVASRVGASVASAGEPRRVLDHGLEAILAATTARLAPGAGGD